MSLWGTLDDLNMSISTSDFARVMFVAFLFSASTVWHILISGLSASIFYDYVPNLYILWSLSKDEHRWIFIFYQVFMQIGDLFGLQAGYSVWHQTTCAGFIGLLWNLVQILFIIRRCACWQIIVPELFWEQFSILFCLYIPLHHGIGMQEMWEYMYTYKLLTVHTNCWLFI
jgi:hypothetical protein